MCNAAGGKEEAVVIGNQRSQGALRVIMLVSFLLNISINKKHGGHHTY